MSSKNSSQYMLWGYYIKARCNFEISWGLVESIRASASDNLQFKVVKLRESPSAPFDEPTSDFHTIFEHSGLKPNSQFPVNLSITTEDHIGILASVETQSASGEPTYHGPVSDMFEATAVICDDTVSLFGMTLSPSGVQFSTSPCLGRIILSPDPYLDPTQSDPTHSPEAAASHPTHSPEAAASYLDPTHSPEATASYLDPTHSPQEKPMSLSPSSRSPTRHATSPSSRSRLELGWFGLALGLE
eukprot:89487-Amorphochlora_amoeboformis.AAC.1